VSQGFNEDKIRVRDLIRRVAAEKVAPRAVKIDRTLLGPARR
jgi:hypothetical protein